MKDKAIYIENGVWEDLPTIKLAKRLQDEKWIKHAKITPTMEKSHWEMHQSGAGWCPEINIEVLYKKRTINTTVSWEDRNLRGGVVGKFKIEQPYTNMKQSFRNRRSNNYGNTIKAIMDSVMSQIPMVDKTILMEKEEERRKQVRLEKIEVFRDELSDVNLEIKYNEYIHYQSSYNYAMDVRIANPAVDETRCYTVSLISGKFTAAEIKVILKVVGTNPATIAERITRNQ